MTLTVAGHWSRDTKGAPSAHIRAILQGGPIAQRPRDGARPGNLQASRAGAGRRHKRHEHRGRRQRVQGQAQKGDLNYAEAVLLGALQGVAEWLPVSSEGLVTADLLAYCGPGAFPKPWEFRSGCTLGLHLRRWQHSGLRSGRWPGTWSVRLYRRTPSRSSSSCSDVGQRPNRVGAIAGTGRVLAGRERTHHGSCRSSHAGDCRSALWGTPPKCTWERGCRVAGRRAGRHRAGVCRASRAEQVRSDSRCPPRTRPRQARRDHAELSDEYSGQCRSGRLRGHSHRCALFPRSSRRAGSCGAGGIRVYQGR